MSWRSRASAVWTDLATSVGEGTTYDVASGSLAELRADGGFARANCSTADRPELRIGDPPPGDGRYLVVRSVNACGASSWGSGRSPTCP